MMKLRSVILLILAIQMMAACVWCAPADGEAARLHRTASAAVSKSQRDFPAADIAISPFAVEDGTAVEEESTDVPANNSNTTTPEPDAAGRVWGVAAFVAAAVTAAAMSA